MADKTHMDYAYELDIAVKPESRVPVFNREFGAYSGAGVPLFSLGGGPLRYLLSEILSKFHARRGYFVAETPIIASAELFRLSGHLEFYRQNMYLFDIEGHEFAVKPMNCPYHLLIFLNQLAKYRSKVRLPFKVFEVGRVHRYEPSGSVYGLLRVRGFTQDDAHIVVPGGEAVDTVYSVFEEMKMVLESIFRIRVSPETFKVRLSVADRSLIGSEFMGSLEEWAGAEDVLGEAAKIINERHGIEVTRLEGEAAFYGPKLDFIMVVEEGGVEREWQMGTIQFDFNLPRRFRLYELLREIHGVEEVYIIHRALLGSIERFLGVYLEQRKGRLPFTLSPVQFAVISVLTGDPGVDSRIRRLSSEIGRGLLERGFRVALKESSKTGLAGDVKAIESTVKPSIMVFVGSREVEEGVIDVRVFSLDAMKREKMKIRFSDSGEAVSRLEDVAGELEKPIAYLSGHAPRMPGDYSHML